MWRRLKSSEIQLFVNQIIRDKNNNNKEINDPPNWRLVKRIH